MGIWVLPLPAMFLEHEAVRSVGSTAAGICGSSEAGAAQVTRRVTSTTSGSSIHPRRNGHGSAGATREILTALSPSLVFMVRGVSPQPTTYPHRETAPSVGLIVAGTFGCSAVRVLLLARQAECSTTFGSSFQRLRNGHGSVAATPRGQRESMVRKG
jgi:hypothetical protein